MENFASHVRQSGFSLTTISLFVAAVRTVNCAVTPLGVTDARADVTAHLVIAARCTNAHADKSHINKK